MMKLRSHKACIYLNRKALYYVTHRKTLKKINYQKVLHPQYFFYCRLPEV